MPVKKTKKTKPKRKKITQSERHTLKEEFIAQYDGEIIRCKGCEDFFTPPYYTGCHAHHILPVEKFQDHFWDLTNVIPLCRKCHYKVHWALTAYQRLKRKR